MSGETERLILDPGVSENRVIILQQALKRALSSLVAITSLVIKAEDEKKPPSKVAASDAMFQQMLKDYDAATIAGREALAQVSEQSILTPGDGALHSTDGAFHCAPDLAVEAAYLLNMAEAVADADPMNGTEVGQLILSYVRGEISETEAIAEFSDWLHEIRPELKAQPVSEQIISSPGGDK